MRLKENKSRSCGPTAPICGNFTKAPISLIEDTRLRDKDVRVWCYIANYAAIWKDFAANRIAEAIGCKSTSVENAIKRLIDTGWLAREKRPHSSKYDYQILLHESVMTDRNAPRERAAKKRLAELARACGMSLEMAKETAAKYGIESLEKAAKARQEYLAAESDDF
ncbi:helix-turn-helix domain-containing protein [Coraliomargarita sp. SDUM461003]|uniref:Helix-turn-helix domain-containing protein n=1 Tax=Thalassobacterium maritimum TaxID=3041265 RepID=A0ABU1AVI6_9BACT|nr:helix-turn-helix domain-containing protein [Coraliomargarita sp. SDUM461003]MDQ8208169.1 helix-turn-helix domain-containing protein [Coraliomargarita sp. SDUM461003]